MNLFKRKSNDIVDTECKICHMKFTDPDRTMRHMNKAHAKPPITPKGIGIVNSINKFDNTMLGIESDGQIKLILDYKSKLGDKQP